MGNFIISTTYHVLLILSHEEDSEMGGACSTYRGEDTCIQGSGCIRLHSVKDRLNFEGLGADRKIILKWSCVDWTDLSQDREKWRTVVIADELSGGSTIFWGFLDKL